MSHVRVCPACGEEFRPEIVRCSDCGAALVDHWEEEGGAILGDPEREDVPGMLPDVRVPADYEPVSSAPTAAEIEPLAHLLGQAGIRFAVTGSMHLFTLLVPKSDLERALGLLGGGEAAPSGVSACPACGASAQGAAECPDCGLALAADPESLARSQRDREPLE
ncbi:MAG TPA: hypothetical protein VFM88_14955 [Vicinamibacteria bacterium]|nr:hypothetical protein [Vicinamibacteria bacterium]